MGRSVRRFILVLVAVSALVFASVVGSPVPRADAASTPQDDVHWLVNAHRSYIGQPTLRRDPALDSAAQEWANEMSRRGAMVHSESSWRAARIPSAWKTHGENIAYGYPQSNAVVDAWLASPGHRENMLRPSYTRMGVGYVASGRYWVQIFAGYDGDRLSQLSSVPTPTISGSNKAGQVLTAVPGVWGPSPVSVAYQWNANGAPIAGATTSTYRLKRTDVGASVSVTVTGSRSGYATAVRASQAVVVMTDLSVGRIAADDRFLGSVRISQTAFPTTADTVYLASGENYPDALSAAPAAVKQGAPLLLTPSATLDSSVEQEIRRLKAKKVVVVGGTSAISDSVVESVEALGAQVARVSGGDRFETSRALALYAFGSSGSAVAFVATGNNFPDALSSGAAAGAAGGPAVLVNGALGAIDGATVKLLKDLRVKSVRVAGGTTSVSSGVEASLSAEVGPVLRLGGADRFQTAVAINANAYAQSSTVYLALGYNFPDALAGSVLAGKQKAPLFVIPPSCVPKDVIAQFDRMGTTRVTLFGGIAALDASAGSLNACTF